MDCNTPGFPVLTNSLSLLKLTLVMPSNHLILCRPLLLLPSIPPSIRVFSNESALRIRWPKYWSFSFNISPSNEYPGLISFRMDWLDLLALQGTLKSLLQHHSSKASVLRRSAFFIVQLSHIHTEKAMAPTPVLLPGKSHGQRSLVGSVHGVAGSQTWLSDFTFTFQFHAMEKEMATHSNVLAWRIPGTGEPGELPCMGSHRIGHDWSDLGAEAAAIPSPVFFYKIFSSFFTALIRMCNYALIFYQFNFCLPLYHVSPMRVKKVTCVPHRSTVCSINIG